MAKRERELPEITYEFAHDVTWKSCKQLGCLVRCVYSDRGGCQEGEWMCCKTCSAMFCEEHRDHAVHSDGINPDSDADLDEDEDD